MQDWSSIKPIESYQVDVVTEQSSALTNLFDNFFGWIDDSLNSRYITLEKQREKMLLENPSLDIRKLDDGYALEAERLNAIQQQGSKGFQIIDINPGLLLATENPLTLPYEFIFDGTNFLPDQNGNFIKNFRSVNIPIAGNFLKIEYIYENNTSANFRPGGGGAYPFAEAKFLEAFPSMAAALNGDLVIGQQTYSFDNFARNKVWVDFGPSTGKPHLVPTNGRIFKTYFNEVNISLNIGAPKIRVTIGFNSEVYEASNSGAINSQLPLMGAGRIFNDSDCVMSPFCLTDQDLQLVAGGVQPNGYVMSLPVGNTLFYTPIVRCPGILQGYSVLFISRINFNVVLTSGVSVFHVYFYINNSLFQQKRIHNFKMQAGTAWGEYVFSPAVPVRVVLPSGSTLTIEIRATAAGASQSATMTYQVDGYSYGEILKDVSTFLTPDVKTSKFITDSTYLSDFNRVESLKDL